MKFHMVIAIILNLNLYVHCMDIKNELTFILCEGGQKWPFFSFFSLLKKLIEVKKILMLTIKKNYDI